MLHELHFFRCTFSIHLLSLSCVFFIVISYFFSFFYILIIVFACPPPFLSSKCLPPVDVWSVGCIVAEMIRGSVLFPGTDRILILCRVNITSFCVKRCLTTLEFLSVTSHFQVFQISECDLHHHLHHL